MVAALLAAQAAPADPLIAANAIAKVSEHVFVISDRNVGLVPNVGIIVGTKATLVVDTGLGARNGETVLRATNGVSRNAELYLVSTDVHPEHALGESAFPATAKVVRFRKADILFDREHTIDVGGLRVRLLSLGPTHTRGDTIVCVEGTASSSPATS
jgi:glyoxylase-like metal-dependent hydrolase (beta-lactamase superfamily II)